MLADITRFNRSATALLIMPGFGRTSLTDQNDFPMPHFISAEEAAKEIVVGLRAGDFEIHFRARSRASRNSWVAAVPILFPADPESDGAMTNKRASIWTQVSDSATI